VDEMEVTQTSEYEENVDGSPNTNYNGDDANASIELRIKEFCILTMSYRDSSWSKDNASQHDNHIQAQQESFREATQQPQVIAQDRGQGVLLGRAVVI